MLTIIDGLMLLTCILFLRKPASYLMAYLIGFILLQILLADQAKRTISPLFIEGVLKSIGSAVMPATNRYSDHILH